MAAWAARMQPLTQRWAELTLAVRVGIAAAALLAVGGLIYATLMQRPPHKVVLFANLSDDDAARIVDKLRGANIPYEFGPDGTSILVPEMQVHETRLMLASEGLPNGGGVGFEVFDQQRFGESEFSEQVKYHRALEGELARTISHLAGVKQARVHLVLPSHSLFAANEQDASASVVVHLVPGWKMRDDQVKGIVHLVASSVRGLDPEHVTLVDGEGRTLGRGAGAGAHEDSEVANEADAYRREIEKSKERAAQQMLDTTLGHGKSMVRVAAAVSFTREEVTEETYDPQTIAQRSFQITEERVPGAPNASSAGYAGVPSNLPGGDGPAPGAASATGGPVLRRSETRNYEVSKVMRRAVEPVGRVTGMQVAVVADGRYRGIGDKKKFESLSKDELDRIHNLVASAIGIDEKRGDKVIVECIAFAVAPPPIDDRSVVEKTLGPYEDYLKYIGMGLLAFIAYRMLRKALIGGAALATPASLGNVLSAPELSALRAGMAAGVLPASLGGVPDGAPGSVPALAAAAGGVPPELLLPNAAPKDPKAEEAIEQVRQLASNMASNEPEAAARVLRNWLAESSASEGSNP
jgi:flagellar M-ring protein FliF